MAMRTAFGAVRNIRVDLKFGAVVRNRRVA
jgi:hypothetical protein